jgi:hypothetical protein
MNDEARDRRTGGQWLRSVRAYLEFRSGDSWRRGEDRNAPERWYYIDGLRTLNGIGQEQRYALPLCIRITPQTTRDIQLSTLASHPAKKLVDELMSLNPALTNRHILMHLARLKLARMLVDLRAATPVALERTA